MTDQPTAAPSFSGIPAAHSWLLTQGYQLTEKTLRNHVDQGKLPAEKHRNGKVKQIRMIDLDRYARQWLERNDPDAENNHRARLIKEQADKIALDNDIKRGRYLDREVEEQRDAAVLASFRRHIESATPDRLQEMIANISKMVDADTRAKIVAMQPAWIASDLEFLSRMFDGFKGAQ